MPRPTLAVVNHCNPYCVDRPATPGDRFRILDSVTDEALRALYGAPQLVWFPSRHEGFGLPALDAMACDTPIIASHASSRPEIASDAALLASPESTFTHAEAIECLLMSQPARDELGARGRTRSKEFIWRCSAAQLKSYFEKLL